MKRPNNKTPGLPPGFSSSKTEVPDEVTKGLVAIFGSRPGKNGDELARFERGRRNAWLFASIGIGVFLCVLAGASWFGFWWWNGQANRSGIHVAVEGPSRVSIGQETSFFVNWFNNAPTPAASVELRMSLPPDFVVTTLDPQPTERSEHALTYRLGAAPAQARGTVKIVGAFTGALGTESAIQVIAVSRTTGALADTETLTTFPLAYTDSVLDGALTIQPKVLPGDRVTVTYRISNHGNAPLEGVEARIFLPDGFAPSGTLALAEDARAARFPVGTLEAGASTSVSLTGTFALGSHGDTLIHAEAGRLIGDNQFAAAQKADATLSVLGGDLSVNLTINGSDKDRSAAFGERQRVSVTYQNTSGEELRDVVLRIRFGGDPARKGGASTTIDLVNWKNLDDASGGRRDHDVLTYTGDEIGQLDRLPANGDGLIEFSVPLVTHATSGRDVPIRASVEAVIGAVDTVKVNRTVTTQPITLRLQTDAELESVARYASEEGAPVGFGPLPPVVATGTTYRIEWTVAKSLHALERVTVSANLPKAVSFAAIRENGGGQVAFDTDRRLVIWKVDGIPADAGETVASFDVTLVPSEADAGRFAQLLGETRFEFTDAALGEPLLRTAPALSTDLPDDAMAKGKGVVKKP